MSSFDSKNNFGTFSNALQISSDLPINLDFPQTTSATIGNLLLLANSYLNQSNPQQLNINNNHQSIDTDDSSENAENDLEKELTLTKRLSTTMPNNPCTICKMEESTVSHFGVEVCTGCRAFFRRSVSQQKTYRCLNSKLCGKNNRKFYL